MESNDPPIPALNQSDSVSKQDWEREFRDWVGSHSEIKIVLSDYAMDRESIYAGPDLL